MRSLRSLSKSTLIAVYVLILVGGVVRSTGSGMGCPDWPRCFGNWVPPSSVADLPSDYKQMYAEYRNKKNLRFAKYLNAIGMDETADKILNDKTVLVEADFNPVKTWIEYGNRIVGVTIGFFIIAVFVVSLRVRRSHFHLTLAAFLALLLVVFQGWLGSFVVSTNLTPWTVTVHMFLALVIVALLIFMVDRTDEKQDVVKTPLGFVWLLACIATLLVQILLGTKVREAIDSVSAALPRNEWIYGVGSSFIIHRSFSWIVLILHIALIVNLRKTEGLKAFPLTLILLILGTILTGVGMAYFAVPAFLQPLHLLLATVSFGMQFALLLKLRRKETVLGT
jgi:heme a synthase